MSHKMSLRRKDSTVILGLGLIQFALTGVLLLGQTPVVLATCHPLNISIKRISEAAIRAHSAPARGDNPEAINKDLRVLSNHAWHVSMRRITLANETEN